MDITGLEKHVLRNVGLFVAQLKNGNEDIIEIKLMTQVQGGPMWTAFPLCSALSPRLLQSFAIQGQASSQTITFDMFTNFRLSAFRSCRNVDAYPFFIAVCDFPRCLRARTASSNERSSTRWMSEAQ